MKKKTGKMLATALITTMIMTGEPISVFVKKTIGPASAKPTIESTNTVVETTEKSQEKTTVPTVNKKTEKNEY